MCYFSDLVNQSTVWRYNVQISTASCDPKETLVRQNSVYLVFKQHDTIIPYFIYRSIFFIIIKANSWQVYIDQMTIRKEDSKRDVNAIFIHYSRLYFIRYTMYIGAIAWYLCNQCLSDCI